MKCFLSPAAASVRLATSNPAARRHAVLGLWLLTLVLASVPARALEGTERFSEQYDLIYQIRDIASAASSKSAIGSGFAISADGLVITNYHVVSNYVRSPRGRNLEYLDQNGNTGPLTLIDFDVINDLALLRRSPPDHGKFFDIAADEPTTGEIIYAVGNPHDLGITLVFGASNGMVEHSYDPQILFSGSLNPGMSGGPGLNEDGQVVGVNVATAGSQLSFLVPAAAVRSLVNGRRTLDPEEFDLEIAAQLKTWQRNRIDNLLNQSWATKALGDRSVPGEIRNDIQCWGSSNDGDDDARMRRLRMSCDSGNRIFIGSRLNTGQIHFSFDETTSLKLPAYRFHHMIGGQRLRADNAATDKDVTPYRCEADFLEQNDRATNSFRRVTYCVRAYKRLAGLFDILFLGEHNGSDTSFSAHYTLAGIEQDLAAAFHERFLATLGWN
ncbi:MAG: serine protease [Pseudomonadota bacterium]